MQALLLSHLCSLSGFEAAPSLRALSFSFFLRLRSVRSPLLSPDTLGFDPQPPARFPGSPRLLPSLTTRDTSESRLSVTESITPAPRTFPMEHISTDPGALQCPDFTLQEWAVTRDEVIAGNPNTTHASAAAILAVGWKAANNEQKRRWTAQQLADQQAEQARTDEQQAEELREEEDRERRRTDAADDERKKYKQKFLPIPDRPLSVDLVIHSIAESARTALRKGELVELYFCTPLGIQAALSNPKRTLDTSSIGQDEDGNLIVTSKADQQAAKGLIQDDDLSMEQFCLATPIFLQQAALAGWPEDRLRMFAQFWSALQNHAWRWHIDPLRVRALIKYQAVQRRRWHVAMQSPGQGYSLALINETILNQTCEEIYYEERSRKDAARDALLHREFASHTCPDNH